MNRALLLPLFFGSAGLKVYLNRASPAVGGIFLGLTAAGLIGQVFGCIIPAYYLYGKNLKRASVLFSYMISKGVVQIVVASTLLDKVISSTNKTLNPFDNKCITPNYLSLRASSTTTHTAQ